MNIVQLGKQCHICDTVSTIHMYDSHIVRHNNCIKCKGVLLYGGLMGTDSMYGDVIYARTENDHNVCYKCIIYCDICERYFCKLCETYHLKKECYICKFELCNTKECYICRKTECIFCIQHTKQNKKCKKCGKYTIVQQKNSRFLCNNCYENIKPLCNICNIKKCACSINVRQFKYYDNSIIQLLNICDECEQDKLLLIKSKYLLITHPIDNKINIKYYEANKNIKNILKTILLIANTRYKYISKTCFLYYVIPNYIKSIVNENNIYYTNRILYKCESCIKYVPKNFIKYYNENNYSRSKCNICMLDK